jgi:hypothetical protein
LRAAAIDEGVLELPVLRQRSVRVSHVDDPVAMYLDPFLTRFCGRGFADSSFSLRRRLAGASWGRRLRLRSGLLSKSNLTRSHDQHQREGRQRQARPDRGKKIHHSIHA